MNNIAGNNLCFATATCSKISRMMIALGTTLLYEYKPLHNSITVHFETFNRCVPTWDSQGASSYHELDAFLHFCPVSLACILVDPPTCSIVMDDSCLIYANNLTICPNAVRQSTQSSRSPESLQTVRYSTLLYRESRPYLPDQPSWSKPQKTQRNHENTQGSSTLPSGWRSPSA
jgi:hypothetical protein